MRNSFCMGWSSNPARPGGRSGSGVRRHAIAGETPTGRCRPPYSRNASRATLADILAASQPRRPPKPLSRSVCVPRSRRIRLHAVAGECYSRWRRGSCRRGCFPRPPFGVHSRIRGRGPRQRQGLRHRGTQCACHGSGTLPLQLPVQRIGGDAPRRLVLQAVRDRQATSNHKTHLRVWYAKAGWVA